MQVINECLRRTTDEDIMYGLLRDALRMAANLEGKEGNSQFSDIYSTEATLPKAKIVFW